MVGTYVYALGIILIGLCAGRLLRWLLENGRISEKFPLNQLLSLCIHVVLLGINPFVLVGAFWSAELATFNLIYLPALGVLTLILGGSFAYAAARLFRLPRVQTGRCSSQEHLSILVVLVRFFLLSVFGRRELGIRSTVSPFRGVFLLFGMLSDCESIWAKQEVKEKPFWMKVLTDPFIMVTFSAIILGFLLNISPIIRPEFFLVH